MFDLTEKNRTIVACISLDAFGVVLHLKYTFLCL